MAKGGFKRKLTAILSADVEGYSRLMGDDEEATVRTLTAYREVLTTLIQQHNGKVLDSPGDNLLAEFVSVVDGVQCAVAVQKEIKARNDGLPENRRMQFRIGINLGDVIQEEGRIYGDGVNIAARLEGLAEPGGICISKTAFDHIESKLPYGYDFIGDQTVKNIAKPVGAYRVLLDPRVTVSGKPIGKKFLGKRRMPIFVLAVTLSVLAVTVVIWQFYARRQTIEPASVDKMAFSIPDKPSIAVLPFENLSGDPEQEYFSDGITEDIITDLSKISGLFVIARNSVFIYKGRPIKIAEVGQELGVRYVLEGSVRKANGRVRITAQLVDATTEGHLWAERYDRDLKDIFELQDEVRQKIVAALAVELTADEQERLLHRYTDSIEAYDYYLRALENFPISRLSREKSILARQMLQKAIDLDPKFAASYALLGWTHSQDWVMGWSQDRRALERAFYLAQKSITLDESLPYGHAVLAEVYLWEKQHDKAIAQQEKTIALSPNDADWIAGMGGILTWAGRPEETIGLVNKAMRLNPMYPTEYLWNLGHAYYLTGRYEDAIETLGRARDREPDWLPLHVYLAASYSEVGQVDEARAAVSAYKRLDPKTPIEVWRQRLPYKYQAVIEGLFDSLQKAGLK